MNMIMSLCLFVELNIVRQWVVVCHKGLRVRASPNPAAEATGLLVLEEKVAEIKRVDNWLQHEQGWSLILKEDGTPLLAIVKRRSTREKHTRAVATVINCSRRASAVSPNMKGKIPDLKLKDGMTKLLDSVTVLSTPPAKEGKVTNVKKPKKDFTSAVQETLAEDGKEVRLSVAQTKSFRGHRRRVSEEPEHKHLPEVKCAVRKKFGLLGVWRTVYIRLFKYALYCNSKEAALENEADLVEAEKHMIETGNTRHKNTGTSVIPLEIVKTVVWNKEKVEITMANGRKIVFQMPSKNPYDAVAVSTNINKHLEVYRAVAKAPPPIKLA